MKKLLLLFFSLLIFFSVSLNVFGQDLTIILVRHAEKDANRFDPALSPEGTQRAVKFFETVKKYNPQQIFSTGYKRTRFTAEPLAVNQNEKYRMYIGAYNPSELEKFAAQLLTLKAKCVVVVGHSNTTPKLANALLKQEKYKELDESVYNKIYIIKVKGKKITDEVIEY